MTSSQSLEVGAKVDDLEKLTICRGTVRLLMPFIPGEAQTHFQKMADWSKTF
jgi:hypothetical protein